MKILLKKQFMPLVQSGCKKTTIRLGKRNIMTGPAEIVSGTQNIPIHINNIIYKRISELSDKDAQSDGFQDKEELIEGLRNIYTNFEHDDYVTIIQFDRA